MGRNLTSVLIDASPVHPSGTPDNPTVAVSTIPAAPSVSGHLAAELRSSVYWPSGTNNQGDSQPTRNYNPLLLRMASVADLPLPEYGTLSPPPFPDIGSLSVRFEPLNAPRTYRLLKSDKVQDLRESLGKSIVQLGPHSADRNIRALNAIK